MDKNPDVRYSITVSNLPSGKVRAQVNATLDGTCGTGVAIVPPDDHLDLDAAAQAAVKEAREKADALRWAAEQALYLGED